MQGCVWERVREGERESEWATAINAVLMHYIKIPGTDKVSHGVQCAKRDKGRGAEKLPIFYLLVLSGG